MKYTITWGDYGDNACRLEITDTTSSSTTVVALDAAENPFVTNEDDDMDPFTPVRTSTGIISFVAAYQFDIDIRSSHQWRVILFVNNVKKWYGWLKGESISQDYTGDYHEVTLNCIDDLAALETWNLDTTDTGFVTLRSMVAECFDHNEILCAHSLVIPSDVKCIGESSAWSLFDMEISKYNFMDKDGDEAVESMSCLEFMQEVCKFFGWSLRMVGETYFFTRIGCEHYTDLLALTLFEAGSLNTSTRTRSTSTLTANGTNHLISIDPGRNMVTVRAELNQSESIMPDVKLDNGTLGTIIHKTPKLWDGSQLQDYSWDLFIPTNIKNVEFHDASIVALNKILAMEHTTDIVPVVEDYWDGPDFDTGSKSRTDAEPKRNYSFAPRMYASILNYGDYTPTPSSTWSMRIKGEGAAHFGDGAIGISMESHIWQNHDNPSQGATYAGPAKWGLQNIKQVNGTDRRGWVRLHCLLRIGDKYWNGTTWTTTPSLFAISTSSGLKDHAFAKTPSNKELEDPYVFDQFVIPTQESDELAGDMEFRLYSIEDDANPGVSNMAYTYLIINSLGIQTLKMLDETFQEKDYPKSRTYSQTLGEWLESKTVTVKMNSKRDDAPNYGQLMYDGYPVTKLMNGSTQERPEETLRDRLAAHYGVKRNVLTLKCESTTEARPFYYYSIGGNTYDVLARKSINWRTNEAEITMRNYD